MECNGNEVEETRKEIVMEWNAVVTKKKQKAKVGTQVHMLKRL